jgi:hypothetical protein
MRRPRAPSTPCGVPLASSVTGTGAQGAMNAHPHDHEGQPGTVYVLRFEPAYRRARHYIGWAVDVEARLAAHPLPAPTGLLLPSSLIQ